MLKWIGRVVIGVVGLAVVVGITSYFYVRSSLPQTSGTIQLAGLKGPVEIIRDRHGVPHISAASTDDLYFALGFVHAQDRLGQMEATRRFARGRLSEIAGPAALDADRFMRGLDIAGQAAAEYLAVSEDVRRILQSYTRGVNAYFETRSGSLPLDLLIAQTTVEVWQPQDSLLWGKLMALQLSGNWRSELARARLMSRFPPEIIAALWPNWPADNTMTMRQLASLYRSMDLDRFAAALPPPWGPDRASNEWVIDGTRSTTGKPILANDPHLGLDAPGQWYLVRLTAPGISLAGVTAPGVPAVVLGHNGRIAWGLTTTTADTQDLFVERVDPADPSRYLTPDGAQPFTTRREVIRVKGRDDVEFNVRATRHGVVVSDFVRSASDTPPGHVLALASPGILRTERTSQAIFEINTARNWQDFTAALRNFDSPVQNFVYADVDGNIGFTSVGKLPKRRSGQGWLPQPGWSGEADWDGYVADEELPRALGSPHGYFANANNRVVPDNFPAFISRDWDPPFRNRRIIELLEAKPKHDAASLSAIQNDYVSLFARDFIAKIGALRAADSASQEALDRLRGWDGAMRRDRPEPLIFNTWVRRLTVALAGPLFDPGSGDFGRQDPLVVLGALDESSPLCRVSNETCAERVVGTLSRAVAELAQRHGADQSKWRWDDEHRATFRHQIFSRIPVLRDWFGFRVPTDGDFFTVNRAASRGDDPNFPFADVHGAGLRAVYDLSNLDASLFMITPGQSGNPLSPHWGDLADSWANGRSITLGADRAALRAEGQVLTLEPAR